MPEVDLARLLAHELEPALISLDIRLRSLLRETACRREAESCLAEVESLRSLVRDFLLLGSRDLACRKFPLAPVLHSLERRFGPLATAGGITLEVAETSVEATGDPAATERVLSNLLDNAVKFSPARSRVRLLVREGAEAVEIEIQDSGVGIAASDHARVFEPFARLDRDTPGAGLGLSIAREFAEAQGGRVSLSSEPGRGSSFVLTLRRV